ncbi:MAG: OmpH family outer membrane protein [Novosphingobium sp.]|nr:OmpH family outer membrane protein [Novosphingobium sp.]
MKKLFKSAPIKSAIVAGLMLGSAIAQPALAQSSGGTVVPGLAVADIEGVIASTSAYKAAEQQRPVTYKAQYDQAEARRLQLNAQLKPLADKLSADSKLANPNQASLQQQVAQIQQLQQTGQNELNTILRPVVYSQAFVQEQIENQLEQAIKKAMTKKRITLVLNPEALIAVTDNAYNLNMEILNELDLLIPAAQLTPPSDWEPRQIREAKAQQAAQSGAQPAAPAATAGPQPTGR